MKEVLIRMAVPERDAKPILKIYKPYIESSAATFEMRVPALEDFQERMKGIMKQFPWLVCEADGEIAGYAYGSRQHVRAAYQWNAELSVYLRPEYFGKGIAGAFYESLLALLEMQGYYNAYGCITLPNDASLALHRKFGFQEAGHYHHAGNKFHRWYDVVWMIRQLREYDPHPRSPRSIRLMDAGTVEALLAEQAGKIRLTDQREPRRQ